VALTARQAIVRALEGVDEGALRRLHRTTLSELWVATVEGGPVVLKRSRAKDPKEREARAREEHDVLVRVAGPGVVRTLGVIEVAARDLGRALVLQYLPGKSLAERLEEGAAERSWALATFDRVATALARVHARGVIHRDLKTANVVFDEWEHPVLIDFGLARDFATIPSTFSRAGGVRGTPVHLAPERLFGAPADRATEVYELGVLLYELLVGALPWDPPYGPDERMLPRLPEERGVRLSTALTEVLMSALSSVPSRRPAHVADFALRVRAVPEWRLPPAGARSHSRGRP
jgi:serine/threonine protein kinase